MFFPDPGDVPIGWWEVVVMAAVVCWWCVRGAMVACWRDGGGAWARWSCWLRGGCGGGRLVDEGLLPSSLGPVFSTLFTIYHHSLAIRVILAWRSLS